MPLVSKETIRSQGDRIESEVSSLKIIAWVALVVGGLFAINFFLFILGMILPNSAWTNISYLIEWSVVAVPLAVIWWQLRKRSLS